MRNSSGSLDCTTSLGTVSRTREAQQLQLLAARAKRFLTVPATFSRLLENPTFEISQILKTAKPIVRHTHEPSHHARATARPTSSFDSMSAASQNHFARV
jgi:hypothetical protein